MLAERNRFLEILHKNGANRKQIEYILKDIDGSGIFDDDDIDDIFDDGFEDAADVLFDEEASRSEKIVALASLKEERPVKKTGKKGKLVVTEEMILQKQREYIAMGLVSEDGAEIDYDEDGLEVVEELQTPTRYGRSPLHEAIAYRNMDFVKKCIEEDKYLDAIDNNGNTPKEAAFYDGWMEVVTLLADAEKTHSKRNSQ